MRRAVTRPSPPTQAGPTGALAEGAVVDAATDAARVVPNELHAAGVLVQTAGGTTAASRTMAPSPPGTMNLLLTPGWGAVCFAGGSQGCGTGSGADGWWFSGPEDISVCDATCTRFYTADHRRQIHSATRMPYRVRACIEGRVGDDEGMVAVPALPYVSLIGPNGAAGEKAPRFFASRGRTFGSVAILPASARPSCRYPLPSRPAGRAASSGRPLRPRRAPRGCAMRSP